MKKPFRNLFALISKITACKGSNYDRLRKWNGNNILIYLYNSNDLKTVEGWSPPRVRIPASPLLTQDNRLIRRGFRFFYVLLPHLLPHPWWRFILNIFEQTTGNLCREILQKCFQPKFSMLVKTLVINIQALDLALLTILAF